MTLPREPLFLARQNYRRRRIADAVRVVPLFGAVLFLLPLLAAGQGRNDTGGWLVYLYVAWFVLILIAAILSRGVAKGQDNSDGGVPDESRPEESRKDRSDDRDMGQSDWPKNDPDQRVDGPATERAP